MTPRTRRQCLLAAVTLAIGFSSCGAKEPDTASFIGTWTYADGRLDGTCLGVSPSMSLSGQTLAIRAGSDSDLELEIGCHCRLKLQVQGAHAVLTGKQPCEQVVEGTQLTSTVLAFDFALDAGTARTDFSGTSILKRTDRITVCESFHGAGALTPKDTPSVDCGPDETAVGVIPYAINGVADCPAGPGRDGLVILLDNENDADHSYCTHDTGVHGEGAWVLPDGVKYLPPCGSIVRPDTGLLFCRVDGRAFRAVTLDPARAEQSYAVLKLGDRCPNGSVEMHRRIDTEEPTPGISPNANGFVGRLGGNFVGTGDSVTYAELQFCYFRAAASPTEAMTEFPDLGFPYAVFHDFDGPQPSWVISKSWHYSDDEDVANSNAYIPARTDGFETIIEGAHQDTCFDMARVQ